MSKNFNVKLAFETEVKVDVKMFKSSKLIPVKVEIHTSEIM